VLTGQRRRIDAAVDVRDLRRGEGDDLVLRLVAVDKVEVVKVAPSGAGDDHASPVHA